MKNIIESNIKKEIKSNDDITAILPHAIYDIKTSIILINKYAKEKNSNDVVIRQSFIIDRVINSLNDFKDIKLKSTIFMKSLEDIILLLEQSIEECKILFSSKKIEIKLKKNEIPYNIMIDRNKMMNSFLNIFLYIFLVGKINGKIKIYYNTIDYQEEANLFSINKNEMISEAIEIIINFECDRISDKVRKHLFTAPLIFYRKNHINNLYLYTAGNIIKKHTGKIWSNSTENGESIIILFPLKSKL